MSIGSDVSLDSSIPLVFAIWFVGDSGEGKKIMYFDFKLNPTPLESRIVYLSKPDLLEADEDANIKK